MTYAIFQNGLLPQHEGFEYSKQHRKGRLHW